MKLIIMLIVVILIFCLIFILMRRYKENYNQYIDYTNLINKKYKIIKSPDFILVIDNII